MEEIKVTFETITPLWTGDASGNHKEIRPSSIMGSLRFWFEVICLFGGITKKEDYKDGILKSDLSDGFSREKLLKEIEKNNGKSSIGIKEDFLKKLPLPAQIFGCTGLKSKIRIKSIKKIKEDHPNNYPIGPLQISSLTYEKFIPRNNQRKTVTPRWFFQKGFQGQFEIVFEVESSILDSIFFPLLNFIEKYGFWGGKWNIGYGRAKIIYLSQGELKKEICKSKTFTFNETDLEFKKLVCAKSFSPPPNNSNLLSFFLNFGNFQSSSEKDLQKKISGIPSKIKIAEFDFNDNNQKKIIEKLLSKKAELRGCLRPDSPPWNNNFLKKLRHQVFGTTSGGAEGTKIFPFFYEEGGKVKVGFVSIAGMLKIGN
jgi:CRISPR-associated protein Cmr1